MLPTFFIIGAAKAGTTSLHLYMDAHPEIAMTHPKEPHLLIGPGWRDRATQYHLLFQEPASIRGEASPGYSVYPKNADAAGNIAEVVPEARIIYLVRDPVERAIAQYAQHVILGMEAEPIEAALRPDDPYCEYVAASRYATQLEAYLQHFDEDRIVVLEHSELRTRRRETLGRLFAHVGADPSFWDAARLERDYNVRAADNLMLPGPFKQARYGRINRWSKRWLPEGARTRIVTFVRGLAGRQVEPVASPELRARLADALAPEAERLRALTGMELGDWTV